MISCAIYRPLNGPLFHLDLVLDENGSHFSTDLDAFKPALVSIFDRGIQATHSVPQMERVWLIIQHLTINNEVQALISPHVIMLRISYSVT